jgi:hypothetical protein
MVYLTLTGSRSAQPLCGIDRHIHDNDDYAHLMYAPLSDTGFRAQCCTECLNIWEEAGED